MGRRIRFKKINGEYADACDRGHIIYDDQKKPPGSYGGHLTIISEPGEGYELEVIMPWQNEKS